MSNLDSSRQPLLTAVDDDDGGVGADIFGQTPSTISVIQLVRNELLGILKRAANRGQILEHCNVELMVEEAMLESNLVQSVDDILTSSSNCKSTSSLQSQSTTMPMPMPPPPTTVVLTTQTNSCNKLAATHHGSKKKHLEKNKMLSKLSKRTIRSTLTTAASRATKNDTRYIVKKIIFDGIEELSYKYVASSSDSCESSSSSGNNSDNDNDNDESETTLAEKRNDMIKFIKTPKMIFGGSSSCEFKLATTTTATTGARNAQTTPLVLSTRSERAIERRQQKQQQQQRVVAPKLKDSISIIHMKGMFRSSSESHAPPSKQIYDNDDDETKGAANLDKKINCEQMSSSSPQKKKLCTIYKSKKLELSLCNKKLPRIRSCVIVKSVQSIAIKGTNKQQPSSLSRKIDKTTTTLQKSTRSPTTVTKTTKPTPTPTPTTTTSKPETNPPRLTKNCSPADVKVKVISCRPKKTAQKTTTTAPLKTLNLKRKLNNLKPESKAKSIKHKLSKIKSEPAANEHEKVKKEIDKIFAKGSKSEPENLRVIKAKIKKLLPESTTIAKVETACLVQHEKDKQKTQKQESSSALKTIPAMSKMWCKLKDLNVKQQLVKSKQAVTPNKLELEKENAQIAAMSKVWPTVNFQAGVKRPKAATTKEKVLRKIVPPVENCARVVKAVPKAIESDTPPTSKSKAPTAEHDELALGLDIAPKNDDDDDDDEVNTAAKTRLEKLRQLKEQEALTPDLQAKMLTAEWLSIAKQLKREQKSDESSECAEAATPNNQNEWKFEPQQNCEALEQLTADILEEKQHMALPSTPRRHHHHHHHTKETTFGILKTPSMKSYRQSKNGQGKLEPRVREKLKTLKPSWSALVHKWECETEQFKTLKEQQSQQALLNDMTTTMTTTTTHMLSTKSTSTTLCARSLQSVSTLVPQQCDDDNDSLAADSISNASSDTSVEMMMSPIQSLGMLRRRSSCCCNNNTQRFTRTSNIKRLSSSFKKKPLKKEASILQRKDNFLRTIELMSFMLDASDTVKAIDSGLDEQDLVKFRWNLEYEKREEAKRKAGKYDAATTMFTSISEPPLTAVETQTDLPCSELELPLSTSASASTSTPTSTQTESSDANEDNKGKTEQIANISSNETKSKEQKNSVDNAHQANEQVPQQELTTTASSAAVEHELLLSSRDYFSSLLVEIRDLLQTTNELSAKAFTNAPLSLWDVREAGRKVAQLKVVKTSLTAKRLNYFVGIEKALDKQIDIMKTIVAYGKVIYPNEISTNACLDEHQLNKLLSEYRQLTEEANEAQSKQQKSSKKSKMKAATTSPSEQKKTERLQRSTTDLCSNALKLARQFSTKSSLYTQRSTRSFTQPTTTTTTTTEGAAAAAYTFPEPNCRSQESRATMNLSSKAFADYVSEISSEYARKVRQRKLMKRAAKKFKPIQTPTPPPKPHIEFQLRGFKQSSNICNAHVHHVHRQYHEHLRQMQRQQLLTAATLKKSSVKRSKKTKSHVNKSSSSSNAQPLCERIPAKNAPYTRTSYVLPVPANQSTGWEIFRWNCGNLSERPSFYADYTTTKITTTTTMQERTFKKQTTKCESKPPTTPHHHHHHSNAFHVPQPTRVWK